MGAKKKEKRTMKHYVALSPCQENNSYLPMDNHGKFMNQIN